MLLQFYSNHQKLNIRFINFQRKRMPLFLTDIDDCRPDSCNKRGKCIDRVAGFDCKCDDGFKGDRCEIGEII